MVPNAMNLTPQPYRLLAFSLALRLVCQAIQRAPRPKDAIGDAAHRLVRNLHYIVIHIEEYVAQKRKTAFEVDAYDLEQQLRAGLVSAWIYAWELYGLDGIPELEKVRSSGIRNFDDFRTFNGLFLLLL